MKLHDWLKQQNKNQKTFADEIGVSPFTVSRYLSGKRRPTFKVMPRIVAATKGAVTANDFFDGAV